MIVWQGKGIRSILVFISILIISTMILPSQHEDYGFVISAFISGIFSWIYGKKWNPEKGQVFFDKNIGQHILVKNPHKLFWIPVQYWGVIFPAFGLIVLYQNSVLGASILSPIFIIGLFLLVKHEYNSRKETMVEKENSKSKNSKLKTVSPIKNKEVNTPRIQINIEEPKRKKLIDMSKEEVEAYHKKYMP